MKYCALAPIIVLKCAVEHKSYFVFLKPKRHHMNGISSLSVKYRLIKIEVYILKCCFGKTTSHSGRVTKCVRPLEHWHRGFEFY
jgi:hypothetical protein